MKRIYGIRGELIEGHNGIFEVMVNNETIFTNQGQCAKFPTEEEVLKRLLRFADLLPGKKLPQHVFFPMA